MWVGGGACNTFARSAVRRRDPNELVVRNRGSLGFGHAGMQSGAARLCLAHSTSWRLARVPANRMALPGSAVLHAWTHPPRSAPNHYSATLAHPSSPARAMQGLVALPPPEARSTPASRASGKARTGGRATRPFGPEPAARATSEAASVRCRNWRRRSLAEGRRETYESPSEEPQLVPGPAVWCVWRRVAAV